MIPGETLTRPSRAPPVYRPPCAPARRARINDVATICGLTYRALRFYEERGLVSPDRDRTGARCYDDTDIERLKFVTLARRSGASVREILDLVDIERRQGAQVRDATLAEYCRRQLARTKAQVTAIETTIAALMPRLREQPPL